LAKLNRAGQRSRRPPTASLPILCSAKPRWTLVSSRDLRSALLILSIAARLVLISTTQHASFFWPQLADRSGASSVFPSWTMDSLVKEWALFLDRCLEVRLAVDLFDATVVQLHTRSPIPGRNIASLLLKPRTAASTSVDPRVVIYLERLLALKIVDAAEVLYSTFQFSKDRPPQAGDSTNPKDPSRWQNPPELDEIVFHRLHKAFSGERPERPVTNAEGARTLNLVTRWMSAMVTSHTNDSMIQAMTGIQQQPQQQSINVREALGMLVVGLIENAKILQLLNKDALQGTSLLSSAGYEMKILYWIPPSMSATLVGSHASQIAFDGPSPKH